MLPLKLRALSDESDESDSDTETPRITKELLEEKALKEYREALTLKQQKQFDDAEVLLLNLVNGSLLSDAEGQVGYIGGRIQPSLVHLKYGCFINLGSINAEGNKLHEALEYYVKAIELDSTDINIWYKIGKIALDVHNLDLAIKAFKNGFECNESHWPTIDSLITALFSIGDYRSCLYMIWRAFELDADYVKGHVFKQYISTNYASFIQTFNCVHADCTFGPDQPIPIEYEHLILDAAFDLRTKACSEDQFLSRPWEQTAKRRVDYVRFCKLKENSWEELGQRMLELYEQIDQEKISVTYYTPVILIPNSEHDTVDAVDMICEAKEVKITEPIEPPDSNNKPIFSKKKNTPSVIEQSHLCDKRRSSRQRGLNKKEDPSLCIALRSVIPEDLLPPREVDIFKDSPDPLRWTEDTMDLFAMLDEMEDASTEGVGDLSADFVQTMNEADYSNSSASYFSCPDREHADVTTFLSLHSHNNILNLFLLYLRTLCTKWDTRWPLSLKSLYCRVFNTVSSHFCAGKFSVYVDRIENEHTSAGHQDAELLRTNSMVLVLFAELTLNSCIEVGEFQRGGEEEKFPSLLFQDLYEAECHLSLSSDADLELYLRLKHFSCLWSLYTSGTDLTLHIELLESLVATLDEANFTDRLVLVNNRYYHVISKEVYMRLRTVLEVTRNIRDVVPLYTKHLYCENECNHVLFTQLVNHLEYSISHEETLALVKLLKLNILTSCNQRKDEEENIYDIVSQYDYLLKLCYELKYNEKCFKYSACYLNKLVSRFKKLNSSINNATQVNDVWIKRRSVCVSRISDIICRLLYCIDKADHTLLSVLPEDQYKQLILNLCQLICYQIEYMQDCVNTSPELTSVPFDTIQHWLVLFYIVKYEETKSPLNSSTESSPEKSAEDLYYRSSPYATRLLFIAHEYLGKRGWCCHENGLLLFKIIDVVTDDYVKYNTRYNLENAHFIEFLQHIDQVFYCLYGHPPSKQCVRNYIKQKYYLQSHNALGVAFTYERAKQVYFFYKSKKVAEFDAASKNFSVSYDVETLFRNIIQMIPESEKPDKYIEKVANGIKNNLSFKEMFSQVERHLCKELRDIYYYIGDYFFKNKVFNKAIRYYLLDICTNHSRVDSWAAMTLSQMKLIGTTLSSGETIEEADELLSDCLYTCNSFKMTTSLNSTILSVYIEYGTFAYTIAAFCSRRIKCESVVGAMSLDQFTALEKLKTELLNTCKETFEVATKVLNRHYKYNKEDNDDKWFYEYMLGKYYEKTDPANPKSCLTRYYQSLETLRTQNGALYPARVDYSEPQTGAVESLELFYRIHATILKFIDRSGDHVLDREVTDFFLDMLRKLSVSRFAFGDKDPVQASSGNVTIVEEENEQDVEIICTVQEVMNNIVKLTQMVDEEGGENSSESDASSSSESESETETECSETESDSSDETSSSEDETERGTKRKPDTLSEHQEKKIKIEENIEQESRKRSAEPLFKENDSKRRRSEGDQQESLLKVEIGKIQEHDDKQVDINGKGDSKGNIAEQHETSLKMETSVENDANAGKSGDISAVEVKYEASVSHEIKSETQAQDLVRIEVDTKEGVTIPTVNNSDPCMIEPIKEHANEEAVYNDKSGANLNMPKACDQAVETKDDSNKSEDKSSNNVSNLPIEKKNVIDSINLLDSINSSCDNIFENLNKIATTCDSVTEDIDKNLLGNNFKEEPQTRTSTTTLSEQTSGVSQAGMELNKATVSEEHNRRKSKDDEIEVLENNSRETDIEILEDEISDVKSVNALVPGEDEEFFEEEVLDPESGMFITVKQKKVQKDNIDSVVNEINSNGEPPCGQPTKNESEKCSMEIKCEDRKTSLENAKADEEPVKSVQAKKGKEESKQEVEAKTSKNQLKDKVRLVSKETEDDSSENSGSSDSESSSSSEEEVIVSKKKKPQKRKLSPTISTKRLKKQTSKNYENRNRKQEMKKWKKDKQEIISYCIAALEECHRRFPEHFKSLYRIAHHYFHSTSDRDVDKARTVLLGDGGLFRARKQKDFFKGLWRTPILDLDRPGSFPYHMSRSIHLVVDLLSETKDAKTLMDIAVALKDEPEAEKKYLRDNERKQFCKDALTVCEKIVKDNLEEVRRNAIHMKSDMKKKIFFDANEIQKTYAKIWGTKDSVYFKMFSEMTKLFQKIKPSSEAGVAKDIQPKKPKCIREKERKDVPVSYSMGMATTSVPPPSVSAAELFFGSHFLANSMSPQPRILATPSPQPRILPSPQPLVRGSPSPQGEMSLQQKLAAKQNPTGSTTLKNFSSNQPQPVPLVNRPLTVSSDLLKPADSQVTTKLPEPGKIINSKPAPSILTKTVTINPTKYLNKTKQKMQQDTLKGQMGQQSKGSDGTAKPPNPSTPLVNIKPLQRPTHLTQPGKFTPAVTKPTEHTAFKLPKSCSLTKVQSNTARPESPKPKPASISKVNLEPNKSETSKPKTISKVTSDQKTSASPKIIDLTKQTLPKALSIMEVNADGPKVMKENADGPKVSSETVKLQPLSVKMKKLKSSAVPSKSPASNPSGTLSVKKKLLGPKSKTKDIPSSSSSTTSAPSSSTSALKNFRKPKDGKDKEEIIMIELD